MNAMPTYQLENIAYHEGLPGHHMQISIAAGADRHAEIPHAVRLHGATRKAGGSIPRRWPRRWASTSIPTTISAGSRGEIWRAIRLVVDTGIHAKGWTQQQAEDYFMANSAQPEQAIKSEIERYILNPGQATSYKIGMITIQKLRDEAQARRWATSSTIRTFHDTVLGGGALPMPVLEAKVRRWIEAQKAAPAAAKAAG